MGRAIPARRACLAYEQLLIDCDRLAARLLDDEEAARRADDLDRHTLLVRTVIARDSHRTQHRGSSFSTNNGSPSNAARRTQIPGHTAMNGMMLTSF
ncbi:hypothetical protein [Rhodococcus opacus]|uniref:hypothetical protein n=1 Tax=Rhodococcus opacus TaxID=37919 RepID=UPI00352C4B0F